MADRTVIMKKLNAVRREAGFRSYPPLEERMMAGINRAGAASVRASCQGGMKKRS